MSTIKDVAQKAGVTVTTVSRILNNRGYIGEETRRKVQKVMEELDYHPNEIARSLFRKKSNMIGIIIPTVSHPFFSELSNYIEYYAYNSGYKILLCNSQLDRTKEKEYVDMLKRHKVDGIIMGSHTLEVDEYVNLNLPVVSLERCIAEDIPYVSADNYEGGRLATNLLIEKGCKKIAHICGSLRLNLLANKRSEAFIDIVRKKDIEHVVVQTELNSFDLNQDEILIHSLLMDYPDIDGLFASSDIKAAYAIKACYQLKKKVPESIKIVGFDDVKIASIIVPQISTIKQPIEEMSRLVIELLIKQINGEAVPVKNILPVSLIERQTT